MAEKFRKKPVVIEAMQFDGTEESIEAIARWQGYEAASEMFENYDGGPLAAYVIETLEGDWQPQRMVLLRFADMDTARRFYNSETYVHARSLREGAGVLHMVIVEGMA